MRPDDLLTILILANSKTIAYVIHVVVFAKRFNFLVDTRSKRLSEMKKHTHTALAQYLLWIVNNSTLLGISF